MTRFNIGDKVSFSADVVSGEQEGIVTQIEERVVGGEWLYLIKTPRGYVVWLMKEDLKMISVGREKVVFT